MIFTEADELALKDAEIEAANGTWVVGDFRNPQEVACNFDLGCESGATLYGSLNLIEDAGITWRCLYFGLQDITPMADLIAIARRLHFGPIENWQVLVVEPDENEQYLLIAEILITETREEA